MLITVIIILLFAIIAILPFSVDRLCSPADLTKMGVRLKHS